MKCPKCGYLGFEAVERCRNCGYDFSLAPSLALPELSMREPSEESSLIDDLSLIDAAATTGPSSVPASHVPPEHVRPAAPRVSAADSALLLFGEEDDDVPLVSAARPPRPPLSVRRATPEVPRLRTSHLREPMLDLASPDADTAFSPSVTPGARGRGEEWIAPLPHDGPKPAALGARLLAVIVDLVILAAIDSVVIYFTLQICGLELSEMAMLPRGPLAAFLLVQNGGYLVAFTVGGQTLGKMLAGIKVVPARSSTTLDLEHAVVRTLVWSALAVPAGLGFLTALASADHRGLHDRVAGTKVVRASA